MFERFTDRARRCVTTAQERARELGHDTIGTEHILLGMGLDAEGVRREVEEEVVDLRASDPVSGHIPFTPRAAVMEYLEGVKATGTEGMATVTTKRTSTVRADGVEDFLAPTCPTCRAAVEETAASRVLEVPQEGGDGHVRVAFVYCEACGATLTSRILDG